GAQQQLALAKQRRALRRGQGQHQDVQAAIRLSHLLGGQPVADALQRFAQLTRGNLKERWAWSLGLKKHPQP
ncbi:MAG TPA: hypothetical protein PLD43_11360, partial [Anaerolineae bacterium]|nr:hypothetical protein [Anaerolineae bacterium]